MIKMRLISGASILYTAVIITWKTKRITAGEPKAASDCRDARFFAKTELADLPMTPGLANLIAKARHKITQPN